MNTWTHLLTSSAAVDSSIGSCMSVRRLVLCLGLVGWLVAWLRRCVHGMDDTVGGFNGCHRGCVRVFSVVATLLGLVHPTLRSTCVGGGV